MCALLLCLCNNKLKEGVTQMMKRLSQQKQSVHGFYKADSRRCFQHVTSVGTTWKMPKIKSTEMVPWPSWLRRGANNAKISSSILLGTILYYWACGVVGSAFALQAKGHRFDSGLVHYYFLFSVIKVQSFSTV